MAAHIHTVFNEVLEGHCTPEELKHSPGYARFGDSLDYQDWSQLNIACDQGESEMMAKVRELAPKYQKYHQIWRDYGCPATVEDWMEVEMRIWNAMKGES